MAGRVIVVGSVNVDLVVRVARLPVPGETVLGGSFERHHGGKGGNQAVAAARLGVETFFVGAVGDDAFGSEASAALVADRVDVGAMTTLRGVPTGVAIIVVDAVGENAIAVAGGANGELTPDHVLEAFERLRPVAGDVVLVSHEIPTSTTRVALSQARDRGATTILNPAPVGDLGPDTTSLADVVTPNRGELAAMVGAGGQPGELARGLIERTGPTAWVLVSLGADGALLVGSGMTVDLAAPAVDAVDTVGAGDALNGALAAGLADGLSLPSAARRAVVAASLAVTRPGAREGMPTAAELLARTADFSA